MRFPVDPAIKKLMYIGYFLLWANAVMKSTSNSTTYLSFVYINGVNENSPNDMPVLRVREYFNVRNFVENFARSAVMNFVNFVKPSVKGCVKSCVKKANVDDGVDACVGDESLTELKEFIANFFENMSIMSNMIVTMQNMITVRFLLLFGMLVFMLSDFMLYGFVLFDILPSCAFHDALRLCVEIVR